MEQGPALTITLACLAFTAIFFWRYSQYRRMTKNMPPSSQAAHNARLAASISLWLTIVCLAIAIILTIYIRQSLS